MRYAMLKKSYKRLNKMTEHQVELGMLIVYFAVLSPGVKYE